MTREETLNNLTSWTKGKSGNPNGRPKGALALKTLFRMVLDHEHEVKDAATGQILKKKGIELVINKHFRKALEGDMSAIKEVYDRYDGKVAQTIVKEGNPDAPLETMVTVRNEGDQEIYERFKKDLLEKEMRKNGSGIRPNTEE